MTEPYQDSYSNETGPRYSIRIFDSLQCWNVDANCYVEPNTGMPIKSKNI